MIISLYPKPTKCYGDTVIRRAEKVDSITEKVDFCPFSTQWVDKSEIAAVRACIIARFIK